MSENLVALERRFERRVLYVFNAIMVAVAMAAIVRSDWWLVAICAAAIFANGLIGAALRKNRSKAFSTLAAGSRGEPENVSSDVGSDDHFIVARSASKFSYLVVATVLVIACYLAQPWWLVIGVVAVSWLASWTWSTWAVTRS
jgi:hypothetical protein